MIILLNINMKIKETRAKLKKLNARVIRTTGSYNPCMRPSHQFDMRLNVDDRILKLKDEIKRPIARSK